MTATIDLNQVVQAFNAIRDARTVKRRAWEAADLELDEQRTGPQTGQPVTGSVP